MFVMSLRILQIFIHDLMRITVFPVVSWQEFPCSYPYLRVQFLHIVESFIKLVYENNINAIITSTWLLQFQVSPVYGKTKSTEMGRKVKNCILYCHYGLFVRRPVAEVLKFYHYILTVWNFSISFKSVELSYARLMFHMHFPRVMRVSIDSAIDIKTICFVLHILSVCIHWSHFATQNALNSIVARIWTFYEPPSGLNTLNIQGLYLSQHSRV